MAIQSESDSTKQSASDPSGLAADCSLLRPKLKKPRLNIVLVEPEIPNNTGNIGRTCVTTGCRLHLVHPLGFDIDEKACRRAGLDYWPRLDLEEHDSLDGYLGKYAPKSAGRPRTWFLTTKASQTIFDAPIELGDHLVFGRESAGLDDAVHRTYPQQRICIPMVANERSLNLSTCVAIAAYESVRKMIGCGRVIVDDAGRFVE